MFSGLETTFSHVICLHLRCRGELFPPLSTPEQSESKWIKQLESIKILLGPWGDSSTRRIALISSSGGVPLTLCSFFGSRPPAAGQGTWAVSIRVHYNWLGRFQNLPEAHIGFIRISKSSKIFEMSFSTTCLVVTSHTFFKFILFSSHFHVVELREFASRTCKTEAINLHSRSVTADMQWCYQFHGDSWGMI